MDLGNILKEFGQATGLGPLALDGNNLCRLVFDGNLTVDIELLPDGRRFYVHAVVGPLPGSGGPDLLRSLLGANLFGRETGGAVLALDPDLDELLLFREFDAAATDYDAFVAALEALLNALERWRKVLAAGQYERPTNQPFRPLGDMMIRA